MLICMDMSTGIRCEEDAVRVEAGVHPLREAVPETQLALNEAVLQSRQAVAPPPIADLEAFLDAMARSRL